MTPPSPISHLPSPKVLVVGLERSGQAAISLLRRHGAVVTATDSRGEMEGVARALGAEFVSQGPGVFEGFDLIVLSPGVPADLPGLAGKHVIGEVELAGPYLKGKNIGITGSNGKTTTTSLVGHILRESEVPVQIGGNIGTAVCAMVETSRDDQWNVLELSSFQLETTFGGFRAHIGVGLNVTQNHLDRHYTMDQYAAAKGRLFQFQHAGDFAVLNADDPYCVGFAALTPARPVWFSSSRAVDPGLWLQEGKILFDGDLLIGVNELPIRGRHNAENVMAAAAAARLAGASLEQIASAVRSFKAVEHRLEFVRNINGIDFYNDSKATSVDATLKALDAFDHGVWIILGGKDKGSDYRTLRDPLSKKARGALLIGAAADKIADHLNGATPLIPAGTLDRAIREAFSQAQPGDTILLAPACASFDQFRSFEHRGETFKNIVGQL